MITLHYDAKTPEEFKDLASHLASLGFSPSVAPVIRSSVPVASGITFRGQAVSQEQQELIDKLKSLTGKGIVRSMNEYASVSITEELLARIAKVEQGQGDNGTPSNGEPLSATLGDGDLPNLSDIPV